MMVSPNGQIWRHTLMGLAVPTIFCMMFLFSGASQIKYQYLVEVSLLLRSNTLTKQRITLLSILIAIGLHSYLFLTYYPFKFGISTGESVCNINEVFNCSAVAASSFSSFLGVPMALWGASANLILLGLFLISLLRLTDHPQRSHRLSFYAAVGIAMASVIMGGISFLFLKAYCLFCMGTYLMSFIAVWGLYPGSFKFSELIDDLKKSYVAIIVTTLTLPGLSFFVNQSLISQYGGENLNRYVHLSVNEWKQNKSYDFMVEPMLAMGPSRAQAKMVLSEFADFLCPHCKHAVPTLHAFVKAHPDVRFEFYAFPLDGECNPEIKFKSGFQCFLAEATYCAAKQSPELGWKFHHQIYEFQNVFHEEPSIEKYKKVLQKIDALQTTKWPELYACIQSPDTRSAMASMAKLAKDSGVEGTPTIYADFKKLPRAQILPVLNSAYETK